MSKKWLRVVGIVCMMLCLFVLPASAGTFVMEEDQTMPLSMYQLFAGIIILAGYYAFTYKDSNSFTDMFCALVCAGLSLFLTIFSFWGVQDAEGHIWKSGWLGVIWVIIMAYFVGIFISKALDVAAKEGHKVSF